MNSIPQKSNSITIDTGEVQLLINNDERRVITFNPEDIAFVEALYNLISTFQAKTEEFSAKEEELKKNSSVDEFGIPAYAKEIIALNRTACEFVRKEIDKVFGEGTSHTAFGNANTMAMFEQFFNGITPFVQGKRQEAMKKYQKPKSGVMKA